jgi:pyruvate ferredoxin oxidoreductase alpha subunit
MATREGVREVVLKAEEAIADAIFSTAAEGGDRHQKVATGAEALLAASQAAREGRRASALLGPRELLGAIEALHDVARARAPITVHVLGVEQALSPGHDEIAPALDVGAGVLVTWSAQDTVDLAVAVRRAAEDSETPFLLFTDGAGPVMSLPGSGLVAKFLGEARGAPSALREPHHVESKRAERSYAARVPFALASAMRELGELTGRPLAPVERFETADADEIVVAVGEAFSAARGVAEALRREGRRVGVVGIRALRPFFATEAVKAVARARAVVVIEPLDVALAPSGPLASSLKAAFADALTWAPGFPGVGRIPPIVSAVFATIDGSVREEDVRASLAEFAVGERAKRVIVFGSDAAT